MDISVVIVSYTILTIIGLVSMVMAFSNKKRPVVLSGFHFLFTLVGFGVFTGFLVSEAPAGTFTWPRISYLFYGVAGVLTIAAVFVNKGLSVKLPKWVPASYGLFEVLGYASLWAAVIAFY